MEQYTKSPSSVTVLFSAMTGAAVPVLFQKGVISMALPSFSQMISLWFCSSLCLAVFALAVGCYSAAAAISKCRWQLMSWKEWKGCFRRTLVFLLKGDAAPGCQTYHSIRWRVEVRRGTLWQWELWWVGRSIRSFLSHHRDSVQLQLCSSLSSLFIMTLRHVLAGSPIN